MKTFWNASLAYTWNTSLACSDIGLSTVIVRSDKDVSGYEIKPSNLGKARSEEINYYLLKSLLYYAVALMTYLIHHKIIRHY